MRQFDSWVSYLDNDGNLLHGKIRFCRKGTTDNVIIYDNDETPLRNPAFTDILGRTEHQVFLEDDADVTAYFYKYIGTGDLMQWQGEDYDPARWSLEYTSDSLDPVGTVDISGDTAQGVANMDGLRAADVSLVPSVGGKKLMWLYGYYNAGDTEPVLYVWDPAGNRPDDGGSVIKPNGVPGLGRWMLAPTGKMLDVRHFGIFGQADKYSMNFSYTSQLSNCADYCNRVGCDAWFPDLDNQVAYYLLDGSNTFSINGDIWCSDTVVFMVKTGTTGTAIQCHELHKATVNLFDSSVQTGTATLTADWIRMSWLGGQVTATARVGWIIDSNLYTRVLTGQHVKFETNAHYAQQLVNCSVESAKKITGPIVMEGMEIKSEWFADDYNWSNLSVGPGCSVKLVNCKDADEYVLLKNKLGQVDYGDLGEQQVTNATFGANCVVENFSGTATLQGSAEIHNCSATLSVTGVTPVLNLVDCWVTLNPASGTVLGGLRMQRGELYGTGLQVLTSVNLTDVTIYCTLNVTGAVLICNNCVINAGISHIGDPVQEQFRNCIFNDSLEIRGGGVNATVQAIWTDNVGNCAAPIIIDRTNLDPDDTHHTYTYENNTGNFPRRDHIVLAPTILTNMAGLSYSSIANSFGVVSYSSGMNNDGVTDTSKFLCQFQMFSVGTANVGRVVVTANPSGYYISSSPVYKSMLAGSALPSTADGIERTVAEWQSEAQVGYYFPKGLAWHQGFIWRITRLDDFYMSQSIPGTGLPADVTWSFIIDRV